ncbi:hypothetical protein NB231_00515 [Nitrococcus mobilis Nb-231]|uniref:Uncharacterized protein n=1 Tax=Nitrococcus mobilis Nb-231 TaxID=314278 RepID=A4BSR4_9GAMM|nr:hypothetical protein NB231_00515 [Nitrococcus mobilis Nb-231]
MLQRGRGLGALFGVFRPPTERNTPIRMTQGSTERLQIRRVIESAMVDEFKLENRFASADVYLKGQRGAD